MELLGMFPAFPPSGFATAKNEELVAELGHWCSQRGNKELSTQSGAQVFGLKPVVPSSLFPNASPKNVILWLKPLPPLPVCGSDPELSGPPKNVILWV